MNVYSTLAEVIKNQTSTDISIYKGEEELEYLKRFLATDFQEEIVESAEPRIHNETDKDNPVYSIENIQELIHNCNLCPDIIERKKSVGSGKNSVMIILNAPALLTAFERNELRNESVSLLKKIIDAAGLDLKECYITNMIKSETSRIDFKPSSMFNNCSHILEKELTLLRPYVVLVMGDLTPLRKIRKKYRESNWFELPHPITLIKNPDLKRTAWNTIQLAMKVLDERRK